MSSVEIVEMALGSIGVGLTMKNREVSTGNRDNPGQGL
jgi:hypothetical protein